MYLTQLDLKKKKLFLDLSIHAAISNNSFDDEQKAIVDSYCIEMGLVKSKYSPSKGLDEVIQELKGTCTLKELNIILIEITSLIMGDGTYDMLERDFMKKIQFVFDISDEKIEKTLVAINQLLKAYKMLNEVIED